MKKLILTALVLSALHTYGSGGKEMVSHQVQPRENLFRISLQYNSTVADIIHANPGLNPDHVRSGTTIKVPKDTKIRDVAFVATFFKGKASPILQSKEAAMPPASQANNQEQILDDENPFVTPKKRKSIEQLEREGAIENNVAQKAFNQITTMPMVSAQASIPSDIAVEPVAKNPVLKAMAMPTPLSIYDQQADLEGDIENPTPIAVVKPIDESRKISPAAALSAQYESEELQHRYLELMRMAANDNSVRVVDMAHIKVGSVADSHYTDLIKQLNLMIDASQVETINLEIVMKDGSVKIITSPEEQRKFLSQMVAGVAVN